MGFFVTVSSFTQEISIFSLSPLEKYEQNLKYFFHTLKQLQR